MSQEKKVDESWKSSVEKEKRSPATPSEESAPSQEIGFLGFVSTLAMQALTAMDEPNLPQARYLIDIVQLLSEKTKGNLSPEEAAELKTLLYELRVKFVKKSQGVSG